MSDTASTNGRPHEYPAPDVFKFGTTEFSLDVVDTCFFFDTILDDMKAEGEKATPQREPTQREYLYRLVSWLEKEKSVTLTLGQMEWLLGELRLLDGSKKKMARAAIADMWT